MVVRAMLSPRKNPFFKTGKVACFLAIDAQGKHIGRIAAIRNPGHEALYHDETGFFGFFDCINDTSVAGALLDKAAGWLRGLGLKHMIGPENLTTNDSVGILTEGFMDPPVFMMPYNFPYYENLLLANGMSPELKLYSYQTDYAALPGDILDKAANLEARLAKRGITFRHVDFKHFEPEMENLRNAYNQSNAGIHHFLPLNSESFMHMARDLKQLIQPGHLPLALHEGRMVGYALTVPDYNQVFAKLKHGNLLPVGWYYLLRSKKYITRCRVMILGVLPAYQRLGIDWCLYARTAAFVKQQGMAGGESCYVMENNTAMNRMLERLNGKVLKRHGVFGREIG